MDSDNESGVPPTNTADIEKRERTLTTAGQEMFKERRQKLLEHVEKALSDTEVLTSEIQDANISKISASKCRTIEYNLIKSFETFKGKNQIFRDFLEQTHTTSSLEELEQNKVHFSRRKELVIKTRTRIK